MGRCKQCGKNTHSSQKMHSECAAKKQAGIELLSNSITDFIRTNEYNVKVKSFYRNAKQIAVTYYITKGEISDIVLNGIDAVFQNLNLNDVDFGAVLERFILIMDVFKIDPAEKKKRYTELKNALYRLAKSNPETNYIAERLKNNTDTQKELLETQKQLINYAKAGRVNSGWWLILLIPGALTVIVIAALVFLGLLVM